MKNIKFKLPAHKKSLGWLFLAAHRDFTKRLLEKMKLRGHEGFNNSNVQILRYIPLEGIRLTDLAKTTEISKQSVSEVVDELVIKGYLKKESDTKDLRAKKISLTELGEKLLSDGREVIKEIQLEYTEIVGEDALKQIEDSINLIIKSNSN